MYTLKVITTVLISFMMLIIFWFAKGKKDKPTIVGFGFMEIVYILRLICIDRLQYYQFQSLHK